MPDNELDTRGDTNALSRPEGADSPGTSHPLRSAREAIAVVLLLHQPHDEEAEFWWDDGPSAHCAPSCSERTCEGHTATVQVCTECGFDHEDGTHAEFRSWPCPTVRTLTDIEGDPE